MTPHAQTNQGFPESATQKPERPRVGVRGVDLHREGPPLEPTYSTAAVMRHLGLGRTKLHELIVLGRKFKGCHPLRGGLFPTFLATTRSRRIPLGAIERHKAHLARLETDPIFRAQMRAAARALREGSRWEEAA